MKKYYFKTSMISLPILLMAAIVLSSCSDNNEVGPTNNYATVFMSQARENPTLVSVRMTSEVQTIVYGAVYGGTNPPSSSISVKFSVDPSLVSSFNAAHGTSYKLLPQVSYELGKTSATIPAGHVSTPALTIKLHTLGNMDRAVPYLLPVTLSVNGGNVPVDQKLQTAYFVVTANYIPYSKSGWKVIGTDSQHLPKYGASQIIDDSTASFWNTDWEHPSSPPHYVAVDMGRAHTLSGFNLVDRLSNYSVYLNQDPKKITIKFSDDGTNWGNGEKFTLPFSSTVHKTRIILSKSVKARYFKFIVNANVGATTPGTNFAEITAF